MTHAPKEQPAAAVAVLHRAAGMWRGLIAATGRSKPTIVAWRQFDADQPEQIDQWLDEHDVGPVIGVLPAAAVICRTCFLPDADPERLGQALQLQAEAHMLGTAPAHRQAKAVLPVAAGETNRSGILLAWPEAARPTLPPTHREVAFAPDVAALAALLNGERPTEPLLWIDRSDGSVALAISHANGAVLRAARDDAQSPETFKESVGRMLAETALSVGHTGAFTESLVETVATRIAALDREAAALFVPQETINSARARVEAAPDWIGDDPTWWTDYGVAVGALLARTDQLAPLTQLRFAAPVESPSLGRRLLDKLSNPSAAVKIAAAALLIAVFCPLLVSGLRLSLLKAKLPDLEKYLAGARVAEDQLAMYRELQDKTWPMAKLLADIACNTPQGIDVDQIRIKYGERASVSGRVKPHDDLSAREVVALMEENFRKSGIFKEIYQTWGDRDSFEAYEFTLSAKVIRPYRRYEYPPELDFGLRTLGDRMYGDTHPPASDVMDVAEASPPEAPAGAAPTPGDRTAGDSVDQPQIAEGEPREDPAEAAGDAPLVRLPQDRPPFAGPEPGSRADGRSSNGSSVPPSQNIPEPLTPGQIQAMSSTEAKEALALVARARRRARADEETKQRLKRESDLLWDRIRELRNRKSSG